MRDGLGSVIGDDTELVVFVMPADSWPEFSRERRFTLMPMEARGLADMGLEYVEVTRGLEW